MKFVSTYGWPRRVLSSRQALHAAVESASQDDQIEDLRERLARLTEIVGDVLACLPPESQAFVLDRHGFKVES